MPSMVAHHPHPTTTDGGSAGFAYVHGWTVVGQRICTGRTVLGQCRSYCRGAAKRCAEEQKPAMRVTVVGRCPQFMTLTLNGTLWQLASVILRYLNT